MRKHIWRYNKGFEEYRSQLGGMIRRSQKGFVAYERFGFRHRGLPKVAATVTEAMDLVEGLTALDRLAAIV